MNELKLFTEGTVKVNDREFTRLVGGFGEDKPLLTTKQIAELMNYDNSIVTRTINRNLKHFQENVDIIDLKSAMPEWQSEIGYTKNAYNASKNIYALSEAGFLLYLKFAEGDKAVELYKVFIEDYFKTKAENKVMKQTLEDELKFLTDQKKFILGSMFLEQDELRKIEYFNQSEKINNRVIEIEIAMNEEKLLKRLQDKLEIADSFTNHDGAYDVGTFSKILGIKGLGRNNMFEWFREQKILMSNNQPYQRFADYFKVVAVENKKLNTINYKTLIKACGVEYIFNRLIKDNKVIPRPINDIIEELKATESVEQKVS